MALHHGRSLSFPSSSHPAVSQFDDNLSRLRSSEATCSSLSSFNGKINGLRNLYESIDDLLLLSNIQQIVSEECVDDYIKLLDACSSVAGRDLPTANFDASLDKLSGLYGHGVSEKSCTREILKRIPNLKKLGIQVELKPYDDDDDSKSLSGLDYTLEELRNLEILVYEVVNPDMKNARIFDLSMFPSSLTKLILIGSGCPWEQMTDIGVLLPNLMQLTLRCYACRGPEWDIKSSCFLKLMILVIEGTDLVRWRAQYGSLPRLDLLSIRHCYKLQQLDWTSDPSMVTTHNIELDECNPLAVASAKKLKPKSLFKVRCHSSF